MLTHCGRVTHICVLKLTIIGSDNGLSPGRRQPIIWTNDGIPLIRPLETNLSEIRIKIHTFSFKKMHLKMSPRKWRQFCLGLNVLKCTHFIIDCCWNNRPGLNMAPFIWIYKFHVIDSNIDKTSLESNHRRANLRNLNGVCNYWSV